MNPATKAAVIEALEDFESSMVGNPSCQKGAVQRCRCRVCAKERGRAALALLRSEPEPTPEPGEREALIDAMAEWVRNNYQDYPTINGLCSAMACTFYARTARASLPPAPTKGTE
jgi:hypothetical protein